MMSFDHTSIKLCIIYYKKKEELRDKKLYCLLQFTKSNPVCVYRGKLVVLLHAVRCIDREHIWCSRTRLTASLVGRSWIPCLELAGDEVVVTADQLEGPLLQPFLDERVGLEVLEGHVDGFLQGKVFRHSREFIFSIIRGVNSANVSNNICSTLTRGVYKAFSKRIDK